MKRKLLIILAVILLLGGIGVFLYPSVKTAIFQQAEKGAYERMAFKYPEDTYGASRFGISVLHGL